MDPLIWLLIIGSLVSAIVVFSALLFVISLE